MDMTRQRGAAIALAGSAGSHPLTIRLIAAALRRIAPEVPLVVLDLSGFDRRGAADYAGIDAEILHLRPRDFGLLSVFPTAGPNLVLSGGAPRFRQMTRRFRLLLERHGVSSLMMCHAWGFPEQALIAAAASLRCQVSQIDEGPFSIPIRPKGAPEFNAGVKGRIMGLARRGGMFPRRELTGAHIDRFFATSPGRAQTLLDRGLDPAKLTVVPCPRFDALAELSRQWPQRPRDPAVRRVLFLHQPFRLDRKVRDKEAARAEHALAGGMSIAASRRPIRITLRMHPRSDLVERERVSALFRTAALDVEYSAAPTFAEDLLAQDMFVGFYSSALLEAAACHAPTAAVALDPATFREAFEGRKASAIPRLGIPVADDAAGFAKLILAGLDRGEGSEPSELIRQHIGTLDGSGAQSVARSLIESLGRVARPA